MEPHVEHITWSLGLICGELAYIQASFCLKVIVSAALLKAKPSLSNRDVLL
jgi:hypothetical protein